MRRLRVPSVRNFAVLRQVGRGMLGSFYLVRDRRVSTSELILFVPSKIRPWPVFLARLADLGVTPVRLRSGQIALLAGTGVSLEELKNSFRNTKACKWDFDALSGFHATRKSNRWQMLVGAISSCIICLVLMAQTSPPPPAKIIEARMPLGTSKCSRVPAVGERLVNPIGKEFELSGSKFRVTGSNGLGGLVEFQIVRECDKAKFKMSAWKSQEAYQVHSIG